MSSNTLEFCDSIDERTSSKKPCTASHSESESQNLFSGNCKFTVKFTHKHFTIFFVCLIFLAHYSSEIKPLEHPYIEVTQPEAEATKVRCLLKMEHWIIQCSKMRQKGFFYVMKEYCKKYTYSKHIDFRSLENLKNDLFLGKNQNPKKMEIIIRILKHFEMHWPHSTILNSWRTLKKLQALALISKGGKEKDARKIRYSNIAALVTTMKVETSI